MVAIKAKRISQWLARRFVGRGTRGDTLVWLSSPISKLDDHVQRAIWHGLCVLPIVELLDANLSAIRHWLDLVPLLELFAPCTNSTIHD